ncbi:MAG: hypothetical protein AAFX46_07025 [Cyanobacteria bacterium J06636_27]
MQQRYLIFRPKLELQSLPTSPDFNLPYTNINISIANSNNEYLNGWWFEAPKPKRLFTVPQARHFRIYQPGENSYLGAINTFMKSLEF